MCNERDVGREQVEQFVREISLISGLSHPRIVEFIASWLLPLMGVPQGRYRVAHRRSPDLSTRINPDSDSSRPESQKRDAERRHGSQA
ncbi:unnamed protein product [Peronospora effusa]|nr:unnamed protein product [Peronospora effusa]